MESSAAQIGHKRLASQLGDLSNDLEDGLLDDIQLDSSFLHDDLLNVPQLGGGSLLPPFEDNTGGNVPLGGGGLLDIPDDMLMNAAALSGGDDFSDVPNMFLETDAHSDHSEDGRKRVSPSTSESGNRRGSADGSGSERAPSDNSEGPQPEEDEAKRQARMQRNRENAFLSRQRKKQQLLDLQTAVAQLKTHNGVLAGLVQKLVAETCLLRRHLDTACKTAGVPVPEVPSAMRVFQEQQQQQQQQQQAAALRGEAAAMPAFSPALMQQPGFMQSMMMKLPSAAQLTRQRAAAAAAAAGAAQPATAAPPAPATTPAAATAAPARPTRATQTRKRARVSGASAAFLALFSLFMFASPYYLPATSRLGSATDPLAEDVLPGPVGGIDGFLPPGNTNELGNAHSSRALLSTLSPDNIAQGGWREQQRAALAMTINATLQALLQDPSTQNINDEALQRLQELAPAAVLLNRDGGNTFDSGSGSVVVDGSTAAKNDGSRDSAGATNDDVDDPLAASAAFPLLASQFFQAAGLEGPQTCQKVFEFNAAALPHPLRSRRSVERYVTGTYGFKGRAAGLGMKALKQHSEEVEDAVAGAVVTKVGTELVGDDDGTASTSSGSYKGPLRLPGSVSESKSKNEVVGHLSSAIAPLHQDDLDGVVGANTDGANAVDVDDVDDDDSNGVLPISVQEPTLVSVLLPANVSDGENTGLTAVDRVFVVMLHPQERFVTYSCGLSRPLLM